jgi:peptide/nickel transport system permease protein
VTDTTVRSASMARRSTLSGFTLLAVVGIVTILVLAAVAPLLAPLDPNVQDTSQRLLPPLSAHHLLGTDQLGRDILSRMIYGARMVAVIGLVSVSIGSSVGILLGLCAGYYGGFVDDVIRWLTSVFLAFPFILLVITVVAVFGAGVVQLVLILGVVSWADYTKVLRAEVMSVRERDFVVAARASGVTDRAIMFRHILPNAMSPLIVLGSFESARLIVVSAALDFLGLGVPSTIPSWGGMLADGRAYLQVAWWLATVPGLAIMGVVVCLNVLGDRLRDILDPRLRGSEVDR